jgi:cytidine deaminase
MTAHDKSLLRAAALAVMAKAHAPYSGFHVGAALELDTGDVITGCNVENASYPLGICAEQAAVAGAIAKGARRFRALAIVTDGPEPTAPCGACRQVLAEFGARLPITSYTKDGSEARWDLAELLPHPFHAAQLVKERE